MVVDSNQEDIGEWSSSYTFGEQLHTAKAEMYHRNEEAYGFGSNPMQYYLGLAGQSHSEPSFKFGYGSQSYSLGSKMNDL